MKIISLFIYTLLSLVLSLEADSQGTSEKFSPDLLPLHQSRADLHFNPQTGLLAYIPNQGVSELLSDSVFNYPDFQIQSHSDSVLNISYPNQGLTLSLSFTHDLEIKAIFSSDTSQTLRWPEILVSKKNSLIWPSYEGYYIPFSDSFFVNRFDGKKMSALYLSLPFWGIEKETVTTMYQLGDLFYKTFQFEEQDSIMEMSVLHRFPPNAALKEPYEIKILHVSNHSPITPALHFRKELEEKGEIVSFAQKIESLPSTERMIGAPYTKLVEGQFITKYDIKKEKYLPLARAIVKDVEKHKGFFADKEDKLDFIKEFASTKEPNEYQEKVFIRTLGGLMKEDGINGEFAKDKRKNAELFYADYSRFLLPPAQWGRGVSFRMIDALKEAGIDKMILRATGHQGVSDRREVAKYAFDQGYLFGIYDSYLSIHDPSLYGTDDSWETAQMPGVDLESVVIHREDGSIQPGFNSKGGRVNSAVIRPYFEKRINHHFEEVAYSYYFIDVDAFGEYYDDYSKDHPMTQQEDAKHRLDRLQWLRNDKQVPIGSEKGTYVFANVLDINEGVAVPIIGTRDKDMRRNQDSPYYRGRYWPPEMQEINFKEVPLKPEYLYYRFNPRFKIPLWETVYHDCLISVAHHSTPSLKYTNVRTDIALTEMFYQYPPMYIMNYEYFQQHKDRIVHQYKFYSQTHPKTIQHHVTDFEYLTEDRLVQRMQFGKIEVIANYSVNDYSFNGEIISGKSILFIDENGEKLHFSPEDF